MRIADSNILLKYFDTPADGNYDFYRCFTCGAVITRQRELEVFNILNNDSFIRMCPCGSMKYSPGFPHWNEWVLPRVIRHVYRLLLVRGVAAWADGRFPWLLRKIEELVREEWEEPTVG